MKIQGALFRVLLGILLPILALLPFFLPAAQKSLERWEGGAEDILFQIRGEGEPHPDIIIVVIDDSTLETLKTKYPFPPILMADLVEAINVDGALAIGLDFLNSEYSRDVSPPNQDQIFGQKLGEWGNVVGGSHLEDNGNFIMPIDPIRKNLAAVGYLSLSEFSDLKIRDYTPVYGEHLSFAAALVQVYAGFLQENWVKGGQTNQRYRINYQGLSSYPKISFGDVIAGKVPTGTFANKIVLVGPTYTGSHDRRSTPFSDPAKQDMAGVEIHANFVANILDNQTYSFHRPLVYWAVIGGIAFLFSFLMSFGKPWISLLTWVVMSLGWGGFWIYNFVFSYRLVPGVGPMIYLGTAFWLGLFLNNLMERKHKQEVRALFSSLVDPTVVNWLIHNPDQIHATGIRRVVTVLDTDIAGFTTITNQIPPEDLVAQLNEYFEEVTTAAKNQGGMHDKFVGDALMMIYGFPQEQEDHAVRAVHAALDIQARVDALNDRWRKEGKPPFETRIGICTGEVVVGAVGSGGQKAITAMGDAANLAARLEGKNKDFDTKILLSESTAVLCPEGLSLRDFGLVEIRGLEKPIRVFSPEASLLMEQKKREES